MRAVLSLLPMSSKLSRIWMTALSLATLKSRVPRGGRLNYLPGVGGLALDSAARLLVTALPLDQNRIHAHIRHTFTKMIQWRDTTYFSFELNAVSRQSEWQSGHYLYSSRSVGSSYKRDPLRLIPS